MLNYVLASMSLCGYVCVSVGTHGGSGIRPAWSYRLFQAGVSCHVSSGTKVFTLNH